MRGTCFSPPRCYISRAVRLTPEFLFPVKHRSRLSAKDSCRRPSGLWRGAHGRSSPCLGVASNSRHVYDNHLRISHIGLCNRWPLYLRSSRPVHGAFFNWVRTFVRPQRSAALALHAVHHSRRTDVFTETGPARVDRRPVYGHVLPFYPVPGPNILAVAASRCAYPATPFRTMPYAKIQSGLVLAGSSSRRNSTESITPRGAGNTWEH